MIDSDALSAHPHPKQTKQTTPNSINVIGGVSPWEINKIITKVRSVLKKFIFNYTTPMMMAAKGTS